MVWGIEGGKYCEEEILSPLGLYSVGGGNNPETGKMTYRIRWIDTQELFCELDIDKIKDIYKLHPMCIRKNKILKIKSGIWKKPQV